MNSYRCCVKLLIFINRKRGFFEKECKKVFPFFSFFQNIQYGLISRLAVIKMADR